MALVEVSKHALDRHTVCWPDARTRPERRHAITTDVIEAMVAGRSSLKEPSFTNHGSLMTRAERKQKLWRRDARDRHVRFTWTEDRERIYLIERRKGVVFVITALSVSDTPQPDG